MIFWLPEKQDYYIAWNNATTLEDAELEVNTTKWSYGKEIEDEFIVTKKEIADSFNIPIKNLIIK